jgi:hypothetical protein
MTNALHFELNADLIAEIKMLVSNYAAEYGRNAGGTNLQPVPELFNGWRDATEILV